MDLSGARFARANLSGMNLSGVDLSGADLSGTDLTGADLSGADLSGADLRGANLKEAKLVGSNLSGAKISGADFTLADVSGASFDGTDLSSADLSRTAPQRARTMLEFLGEIPSKAGEDTPGITSGDEQESIDFRVYQSGSVELGSDFVIDVWFFRHADLDSIQDRQREILRTTVAAIETIRAAEGSIFTMRMRPKYLELADGSEELTISGAWHGDPLHFGVALHWPASTKKRSTIEMLELYIDGMFVARIPIEIKLGLEGSVRSRFAFILNAFASYSSADREVVMRHLQVLDKILSIDVFADVERLRSGDDWRNRLRYEIMSREKLFLFWSDHAATSPEVEVEWRQAYETKGLGAIEPFPLMNTPPPEELASLHFADRYMILAEFERMRRETGKSG